VSCLFIPEQVTEKQDVAPALHCGENGML